MAFITSDLRLERVAFPYQVHTHNENNVTLFSRQIINQAKLLNTGVNGSNLKFNMLAHTKGGKKAKCR